VPSHFCKIIYTSVTGAITERPTGGNQSCGKYEELCAYDMNVVVERIDNTLAAKLNNAA
jgi:hypothetical protein